MLDPTLIEIAEALLAKCRSKGLTIATAESCTGGLIGAVLTEVAGSSDVFERGFITYSNAAKIELLNVAAEQLAEHGAVSEEVACAMAEGALRNSQADLSVAVTGIAGPGGGSAEKPVGLVYIAVSQRNGRTRVEKCLFGDLGRAVVRKKTVEAALKMLLEENDGRKA